MCVPEGGLEREFQRRRVKAIAQATQQRRGDANPRLRSGVAFYSIDIVDNMMGDYGYLCNLVH